MDKKFTLLEFLVVLAIIGLLVSILVPSLAKARSVARQAVCLSNSQQIAKATHAYMVESDRYGPIDDLAGSGVKWFDSFIPFYLPEGDISGGASPVNECPDGMPLENDRNSTIAMNSRITGKIGKLIKSLCPQQQHLKLPFL
ncbi:MAG: prepilin-type N-terminal cleavage/methylation domain-containing protein [Lentisphaerales bacterium]|nr:prepilin-type N-terminal cleavage/methylation domain-containing protein [Lentisphaerales bacterium]